MNPSITSYIGFAVGVYLPFEERWRRAARCVLLPTRSSNAASSSCSAGEVEFGIPLERIARFKAWGVPIRLGRITRVSAEGQYLVEYQLATPLARIDNAYPIGNSKAMERDLYTTPVQ
ncbi:hypothetical protein CHU98_g7269 [Xylaria longipes]|nr:hypothetical protein CHU98_g7269 [Xylaria longipes]